MDYGLKQTVVADLAHRVLPGRTGNHTNQSISPDNEEERRSPGARSSTDPAPAAEEEEEEENEPAEFEEGRGPNAASIPVGPTKEEMDEHMLTHIPYRQWCQHCVSGKAKGNPHQKSRGYVREMPTIVLDYMYMRERQGEGEEGGMPILVAHDLVAARGGTGNLFARVVPAKGVNQYAVQSLSNELSYLGHKEFILKSDGEPAIVALKEAIKAERQERIVLEKSPVGESRSNGAAENAVQQIQGQVRAIKHALESRLQTRVPEASNAIPWLIMHAARTINRYRVGKDGRTAYRRIKGKEFRRPIAEFGETVLYLKPNTK